MEKLTQQELIAKAQEINNLGKTVRKDGFDTLKEYERNIGIIMGLLENLRDEEKSDVVITHETLAYSTDEQGNINGRVDVIKCLRTETNEEINLPFWYFK